MLHNARQRSWRGWIWPPLILALFLGAQLLEVSHLHADAIDHAECIQCQSDSGHLVCDNAVHNRPSVTDLDNAPPNIPTLLSSAFVNQTARGPPAISV